MTHRVRGGFVWPIYIADAQGESRTRAVMARAERKENKVNYGCYKYVANVVCSFQRMESSLG